MIPSNPAGGFISTFGISTFGSGNFGISTFGMSGIAIFGASIFGISSFGMAGIFGTDETAGMDGIDGNAGTLGRAIVGTTGAATVGMFKLGILFCF